MANIHKKVFEQKNNKCLRFPNLKNEFFSYRLLDSMAQQNIDEITSYEDISVGLHCFDSQGYEIEVTGLHTTPCGMQRLTYSRLSRTRETPRNHSVWFRGPFTHFYLSKPSDEQIATNIYEEKKAIKSFQWE